MRRLNKWRQRTWWRRLVRFLRDDRGSSDTVQQLMWILFWLGVILVVGGMIRAWTTGLAQEIIGF